MSNKKNSSTKSDKALEKAQRELSVVEDKLDECNCIISDAMAFAYNMLPNRTEEDIKSTLDEQLQLVSDAIKELQFPWLLSPLDSWTIVGMNHYRIGTVMYLFVAMTKNGKCIVTEGPDGPFMWDSLRKKAIYADEQTNE